MSEALNRLDTAAVAGALDRLREMLTAADPGSGLSVMEIYDGRVHSEAARSKH